MDNKWTQIPSQKIINKTIKALTKNGMKAEFVQNKKEAKEKVLSLIPKGVEIMTMTSVTLDAIGIPKIINESRKFNSVRKKFANLNRETDNREMQRLGAAPEWAIGSVHAVTESGEVIIASNTGSQLASYVYGADHVIWVVGVQKIVQDKDEGMKRLMEHTFPLENERAMQAYGMGSNVSKILVVNKEIKADRIKVIFVNEVLGF